MAETTNQVQTKTPEEREAIKRRMEELAGVIRTAAIAAFTTVCKQYGLSDEQAAAAAVTLVDTYDQTRAATHREWRQTHKA